MRALPAGPWLLAAVLAGGIAACAPPETPDGSTPAPVPSARPDEAMVLGEFTDRFGFRRKYVKVRPGLDDAAIVAIATRLHAQEPKTWFWLLDDDGEATRMLAALPRIEKGEDADYPLEWVRTHSVAHVQLELVPGAPRRWVVVRGDGSDTLAVLGEER